MNRERKMEREKDGERERWRERKMEREKDGERDCARVYASMHKDCIYKIIP
jgi:hypothetical protein